jgi:adenylate kinase family enzyme
VERVVVLGRGGAGKSTFARMLAVASGLTVIELDKAFWSADLEPLPKDVWAQRQALLAAPSRWIMDGDLGPYDDVAPRLRRADTVVVLDLPLWRCAWRAWRRGRERRDFWVWTVRWRRDSRPALLRAVAEHAPEARLVTLRCPAAVRDWLASVPPTR